MARPGGDLVVKRGSVVNSIESFIRELDGYGINPCGVSYPPNRIAKSHFDAHLDLLFRKGPISLLTLTKTDIKTWSPRGVNPYESSKIRWPRITLDHKVGPEKVNHLPEASGTMNMFGVEQSLSCASSAMNVK